MRGGIPLADEVFEGNRVDVLTVKEIVTAMETRFGAVKPIWVMDRGMASEKNLPYLREGDRRYLIGESKSDRRRHEAKVADEHDWTRDREDVEVKLRKAESGAEACVRCHFAQRRAEFSRSLIDSRSNSNHESSPGCDGRVRDGDDVGTVAATL